LQIAGKVYVHMYGVGLNTMNFERQFTPFYNIIVAFTHDRQIREHSLEVCGKPKVGSVVI